MAAIGAVNLALAQGVSSTTKYNVGCSTCRIEITKVTTIGSHNDPVRISPSVGPVRDSNGRYFAASFDRKQVAVFDSAGKYLTVFAPQVEAPADSSRISIVGLALGLGDTLWVWQDGRISAFDPDLRQVWMAPAPIGTVMGFSALSNGTFVVAAIIRTASNFGYPFHILDRGGGVLRSFGDPKVSAVKYFPELAKKLDNPPPLYALGLDGASVWVAPEYHVRQFRFYGAAGASVDVVDSPWLPAAHDSAGRDRLGRPYRIPVGGGSIDLAGVESDGLVWIVAQKPGEHATPGTLTTALEVFDVRAKQVLVSAQAPAWLRFLSHDLARSLGSDKDGHWTYTIWRVRFLRT